ncbi:MAG: FABP family protein [Actinobacteria bacterium 13_2_20CM_2_71_6]|nr:MAG: FABP family protein [Actinobacteria bacterium 13_2_20CM_2_71_6]
MVNDNPIAPPWLTAPPVGEYPYEESHDLRTGPELHPALLGLLPFVGVWRGRGGGEYPTIQGFGYAQEVRFSHDGLLTAQTGVMELYVGRIDGLKVELVTDAVVRTVTAKEVSAGQRLYGIVDGALLYAHEMAAVGQPLTPHLSAKLNRVAG